VTAIAMPDEAPPGLNWRKATRSISNGACVEVGTTTRIVAVRDSTDRTGQQLVYPTSAWRIFARSVQLGQHDIQY
jgi:hypothetical protein